MIKKYTHKICIISDLLAIGGAEKSAAVLSNYFEKKNICVHHIIIIDKIVYQYSGTILNLGKYKNNSFLNKFKRFQIFKNYLKENSFDFIIDNRVRNNQFQEFFLNKLVFNSSYIVVVHNYLLNLYFPKWKLLAKKIYKNSYKIITVSKKIEEMVSEEYKYSNTETIYNPIDFDEIESKFNETIDEEGEYIIAIGRMEDDVKQFDKLISAYSKSILLKSKIKLLFLGSGKLLVEFEKQVNSLTLQNFIIFKGWQENPYPYIKNAKYLVLCSKFEGFPNVIIESLGCETPVISFDCLSGPNEVVIDKYNGLLVENQNFSKLTQAMNIMIEDKKLYEFCKKNTLQSVEKFSIENIGNQWIELFKTLKK